MMKLPSIIENTEFDEKGFALVDSKVFVPAYVASQHGFSYYEDRYDKFSTGSLLEEFYEALKEKNILPLCPFKACREHLDLEKLGSMKTINEQRKFWEEFNDIVGKVNCEQLMPRSKLMIAILDGGHAVDDGVAAEIGYYSAKFDKPIIAVRNDIRVSENQYATVNAAVSYFIEKKNLFSGPAAYERALDSLENIADSMVNE